MYKLKESLMKRSAVFSCYIWRNKERKS